MAGGGQIAYTLMRRQNQRVMEDWVVNLQPQAFGPLLLALSSAPKAFTVQDDNENLRFDEDLAHLLQQQAIEQCFAWISSKSNAALQFEEAIICMNRDGVRPPQAGITYCRNKLRIDLFMAERVLALSDRNNIMRAKYRDRVAKLGARLNEYCSYNTIFNGPAFAPLKEVKTNYKGPNID